MRILLVALNAKYIHTNLALRYLREGVRTLYPDVLLKEFSINDHLDRIAGEIYEAKADVVGFSCYIWNLKETVEVIRQLHPVCPNIRFVLGGPEVSFESEEFLLEHPEVDALVIGEGEKTFLELLKTWQDGHDPSHVQGIAWTKDGKIMVNPAPVSPLSMNDLPFPYTEDEDFTGRLVYVETTRGCPFNCQYCLSSTFQGVRFLEPERFRMIFRQLLKNGARTIKFVDRTFNANKRHALGILDIVREESELHSDAKSIRVHCEMAGDLLDAEWMDYFRNYPRGLVQLEIGVQSTHQPTLKIVSRPQRFKEWKKYIAEMRCFGIPLHLDLIAGLPEENWLNFRTSFNEVYETDPDMLQLGFLKVLKGSGLRLQSSRFGLLFVPDPPYTILETKDLSHNEILQLQRMESILDKYYNSGKFEHALRHVLKLFPTPFDFYHKFAGLWHKKDWFSRQWQGKALFDKLWEFLQDVQDAEKREGMDIIPWNIIRDALRFDYYMWERPNIIPDYLQDENSLELEKRTDQWKTMQDKIRKDAYCEIIIPEVKKMDRRQWNRNTAIAYFTSDLLQESNRPCWYLFHYQQGKVKAYRYEES
ncbi:B12-binding domain-containing radical SAM protein [Desulfosporosinus sp.]|uniref:B12-binding domain-containing radical SAM protein n=1 Tax=Desulfosporosinus sp. TaxID=157907 RepID=UPI00231F6315|nr:B12-binding domain-containing radical SAM protein [Desulfosporosinus sp.]MDA8220524.1 B12-binding domain-containing radical SAM protein [Desulfitobacterium hafniense]